MNTLEVLTEKLENLRSGNLDISDFRQWFNDPDNRLIENISRGLHLKIRHGDMEKIMLEATFIVMCCIQCNHIFDRGEFSPYSQSSLCSKKIELAVHNKSVSPIPKPDWHSQTSIPFGVYTYYQCTSCNAIWHLVLSERKRNGLWERIA